LLSSPAEGSRPNRPSRRDGSTVPVTEPSFAEHVCLALIVEGVTHGWAVGSLLAPRGELGRIWSLTRPLSYRAIDGLVEKELVSRRGHTPGQGRERVLLAPTAEGRQASRRWLDTPVQHVRDVRTELLMKLTLRERAGLDTKPLLRAQRDALEPTIEVLTTAAADGGLVELWRREQARAVRRFLDEALEPVGPVGGGRADLRLSARNQVRGTITAIKHGGVMSTVKAVLGDGQTFTAAISREAVDSLDLVPGDQVLMIVKSTEVMVAKPF
jgi:PadR family transcriptional regulator AphA